MVSLFKRSSIEKLNPDSIPGLEAEIAQCEAALKSPEMLGFLGEAALKSPEMLGFLGEAHYRTRLRVAQDRLALKFLPDKPHTKANSVGVFVPGREQYNSLLKRAQIYGLADDWLDTRLSQAGVNLGTLEGWNEFSYHSILGVIQDLERKTAQTNKKLKKRSRELGADATKIYAHCGPVAPPGYFARPVGDGTYTHVSSLEHQGDEAQITDFNKVGTWAERFGMDNNEVCGIWKQLEHVHEGKYTKTALCALQDRLRYVMSEREKGKDMALFSKTKQTEVGKVDTITGEVTLDQQKSADEFVAEVKRDIPKAAPPAAKEIASSLSAQELDAIREQLGLKDLVSIDSLPGAQRALKKRAAILAELALIETQYREIKLGLLNDFQSWEKLFLLPLEEFRRKNPPETGKSLSTLYGDLNLRNKPEYISFPSEDDPEYKDFEKWLADQDEQKKFEFNIKPYTKYTRDLESIKMWMKVVREKTGKIPPVPGAKVKPAVNDAFVIAPSLDTFEKKLKEQFK